MQLSIEQKGGINHQQSRRKSDWLAPKVIVGCVRLTDAMVIALSGAGALLAQPNDVLASPFSLYSLVLAIVLAINVFQLAGLYRFKLFTNVYEQARRLIITWPTILALMLALGFATNSLTEVSRMWAAMWLIFGFLGLLANRIVMRFAVTSWQKAGHLARNIVVIGAGEHGQRFVEHVRRTDPGVRLVGLFDDRRDRVPDYISGYPVLGSVDDVVPFVRDNQIDQVVIALPWNAEDRMLDWIGKLRSLAVDVRLSPDTIGYQLPNHGVSDLGGVPLLNVMEKPLSGWNAIVKDLEDRLLAFLILCMISPLMLLIGAAVRLTSKGPAFFCQKRYGFNNEVIEVYKFRSMYVDDCDDGAGKTLQQAKKDDSRITPLGAFLRRTSLDELPQFINVLKGDMSIVGPRPHAVAHNEHYAGLIDQYLARHRVKPGITGWAQVNGLRGETETVDKMQKRVQFDLFYIENWSLALDFKIILLTLCVGFSNPNAY